jgi:hypothetical protein
MSPPPIPIKNVDTPMDVPASILLYVCVLIVLYIWRSQTDLKEPR